MNEKWKSKAVGKAAILIAMALIAVSLQQIPGVTMGRYMTKNQSNLAFTVLPAQKLYLLTDRTEQGVLLERPGLWVPDEKPPIAPAQSEQTPAEPSEQSVDSPAEQAAMPAAIQAEAAATPGQCVRFCVSNADVEGSGYTDKDISFRVRVFVPDNLQLNSGGQQITPGKLNLGLCIGYDGALYTAPIKGTPTFLSTLTYRCIKNGTPYWVYTFCVAGREQHFTLQGGQVSDLYVKITLDDPSIDATSFVLQVDEVRLNK